MAWEWEAGLRSRIFRLRRPNIWARLHYGLDKDGVYSPKIEARGRAAVQEAVSCWHSGELVAVGDGCGHRLRADSLRL